MNVKDPQAEKDLQVELDTLLRSCIQCGLCLSTCATYLATGSEVQSPRGRLLLLGEILAVPHSTAGASGGPARDTMAAFDLCLGCRACETACPSGVSHELLDYAKDIAAGRLGTGNRWLARDLASRHTLRRLRAASSRARSILAAVWGSEWRRRLDGSPGFLKKWVRRLGTVPTEPVDDAALIRLLDDLVTRVSGATPAEAADVISGETPGETPGGTPGESSDETSDETPSETPSETVSGTGPTVAFFHGCANDVFLPGTSARLQALLRTAGCCLVTPSGLMCCGAVDRHTGRPDRADSLRVNNAAVLIAFQESWDYVVVEAAGCGLELKSYPPEVASRARDASELLVELPLPEARSVPLKVALHDPCHARHGQGIVAEPRRLLGNIPGLLLLEPEEPEVCCGSGGTYSLFHPDLADTMGRRKAELLAATGADLVVTTNPGCLGQIADGLAVIAPELPILPLSDLLWYAHLGREVGDEGV